MNGSEVEKMFRSDSHQSSITDLAVTNSKVFASASWDKTIKLFSNDDGIVSWLISENIELNTIVKKTGKKQKMEEEAIKVNFASH